MRQLEPVKYDIMHPNEWFRRYREFEESQFKYKTIVKAVLLFTVPLYLPILLTIVGAHIVYRVAGAFNFLIVLIMHPIVALNYLSATLVVLVRGLPGLYVAGNLDQCDRPKELLHLYCLENAAATRVVRELLSVLDIDVQVFPCPLYGQGDFFSIPRYRHIAKLLESCKKESLVLPLLHDPTTGLNLAGRGDIVKYLLEAYGSKAVLPLNYRLFNWGPIQSISLSLATLLRKHTEFGLSRVPHKPVHLPLELFSSEVFLPSCVIARDRLCELEIPYILKNVSIGCNSTKLGELDEFSHASPWYANLFNVPFNVIVVPPILHDPNTAAVIGGSFRVVQYLDRTYGNPRDLTPRVGGSANGVLKPRTFSDLLVLNEVEDRMEGESGAPSNTNSPSHRLSDPATVFPPIVESEASGSVDAHIPPVSAKETGVSAVSPPLVGERRLSVELTKELVSVVQSLPPPVSQRRLSVEMKEAIAANNKAHTSPSSEGEGKGAGDGGKKGKKKGGKKK